MHRMERVWAWFPDGVRVRRWLIGMAALIAVVTYALNRWHTPRATDPVDTALAVVMAVMAASYLLFMVLTRREWPASALGLTALLAGELILWGLLVVLTRLHVVAVPTETMLNSLRSCFLVGGIVLLFDLGRWLWARWGRRSP